MRRATIIFISLITAVLSCTRIAASDDVPTPKVDVVVSTSFHATKTPAEDMIDNLQVFFFKANGDLAYRGSIANGASVRMQITPGTFDVFVIANSESIDGEGLNKTELLSNYITLLSQNPEKPTLIGNEQKTVTNRSASISINVSRVISRVIVHSITNALPEESLNGQDFTLVGVYLTNACGSVDLSGDSGNLWYNKMGHKSEADSYLYHPITDGVIGMNTSKDVELTLYLLPNSTKDDNTDELWSSRHTRIVLKTKLGDTFYYYQLTLPKVGMNESYEYGNIILKRLGSTEEEKLVPDTVVAYDSSLTSSQLEENGLSFESRFANEVIFVTGDVIQSSSENIFISGEFDLGDDPEYLREYHLEITDVLENLQNNATSQAVASVSSYYIAANGAKHQAPWTAEFSTDGVTWSSTPPSWLTSASSGGNGSLPGETPEAMNVVPKVLEYETMQTFLPSVGTPGSPVDVSTRNPFTGSTVSRETANSYIITAPGYYKLPLYFGNAIKNGSDVLSACAPLASSGTNYGSFVDADNHVITSGNILTQYGGVSNLGSATLIWQTQDGFVEVDNDIQTSGQDGFITFRIYPSQMATEGCALIGVTKNGNDSEFIWSWLLWFVSIDDLVDERYENTAGKEIVFLSRSLGETYSRDGYDSGKCYVRISNLDKQGDVFFIQNKSLRAYRTEAVAPYFQWGSPIAMPPSGERMGGVRPYRDQTCTLYYDNNAYTWTYDSSSSTYNMGKTLSKPYVIRLNNDFFQTATNAAQPFYNMWDASRTNTENRNTPIKSIYDPCPPGYSVPLKDAFTAFSANKVTSTSTNLLFKKTSADENPSIWPMLGYRYQTTAVYYNAWAYWTSCPLSQDKAHRPDIRSNVVYYSKETNRYVACSIRPMKIDN